MPAPPLDPAAALGGAQSAIRTGRWAAGWTTLHPYAIGILLLTASAISRGPVVWGAFVGESFRETRSVHCEQVGSSPLAQQCIDRPGGGGIPNGIREYDNKRPAAALTGGMGFAAWSQNIGITVLSAASLVTFLSLFDEPAYQATPQGWQATKGHVSLGARKRNLYTGSRRVWQTAKADQVRARSRLEKAGRVWAWWQSKRQTPAEPRVSRKDRRRSDADVKARAETIASGMTVGTQPPPPATGPAPLTPVTVKPTEVPAAAAAFPPGTPPPGEAVS